MRCCCCYRLDHHLHHNPRRSACPDTFRAPQLHYTIDAYVTPVAEPSAVFLGDHAASLTEPLAASHVYRKHPVHGVLYQNWTVSMLEDGDVLVVRHHDSFFSAASLGSNSAFPIAAPTAKEQDISDPEPEAAEPVGWRPRLWKLMADPSSSRCAASCLRVLPPCALRVAFSRRSYA